MTIDNEASLREDLLIRLALVPFLALALTLTLTLPLTLALTCEKICSSILHSLLLLHSTTLQ